MNLKIPTLQDSLKFFSHGLLIFLLLISIACKTTERRQASNPKPGTIERSSRDFQMNKGNEDWDRIIEHLSKSSLTSTEADFAFLVAENFINQKQLDPALKLMRSVFASHPTLVSGIELVRLSTLNGDINEAEQVARKLQLFYGKSPEPSLARAYLAQLKGNRAEATEILESTYRKHPKNEEVSARYINLLLESGKKTKAKDVLMQSITSMPRSPYFLLKLARLKTEEKNYKEAKNLLDKLLKISPDNIEAWTLAGFIAIQENNGTAAERYFREAYEKQPENDTLARYYVTQLLKLNKFQEARRLLLRLEASSDSQEQFDPDLMFQLGYVLFQLEEFEEAKKKFLILADKTNEKDRLYFYAAQCFERLNNPKAALELYLKIQESSEVSRLARQRIVFIKIDNGDFSEAEKLLTAYETSLNQKLIEEDYKFLAGAFSKMKQFKKALQNADAGLKKHPESIDLEYLRSAYLEHTQSKAASLQALEKIATKHPNHVQTLNHLAYMLAEANIRLDFAFNLIQSALKKDPKNGFYLDTLGWIQVKLKLFREADKTLSSALAAEPNEPVIHEHFGELKLAVGEYSAALKYFESAEAIFKKHPNWKIDSDIEWSSSRERVRKRIDEIQRRALPES
jgi:tetratricopeptide (TPR) repeat protein